MNVFKVCFLCPLFKEKFFLIRNEEFNLMLTIQDLWSTAAIQGKTNFRKSSKQFLKTSNEARSYVLGLLKTRHFETIEIYFVETGFTSPLSERFCYMIFNSHMFNAPRFNSEKDVSLPFFFYFKWGQYMCGAPERLTAFGARTFLVW
jgi:hypothetical protein